MVEDIKKKTQKNAMLNFVNKIPFPLFEFVKTSLILMLGPWANHGVCAQYLIEYD